MAHYIILGIGIAVAIYAVNYYRRHFLRPARQVNESLTTTLTALREISAQGVDPEKLPGLAAEAMRGESLTHAWLEFKDTLHAEIGPPDEFGGRSTSRYRQTVPADVFFSPEALVYSPMNAEFFRHFPGMLTATGIVLTFSGLILGLHEFGITSDINSVADKVNGLIATVGWAFAASALMIIIAVVTTYLEKRKINANLKLQHEVCVELDKMFDAGVGEEYLQRLVTSSEDSATSAKKLKDQLVEKLEELLDAQSEKTTAAINAQSQVVGEAVRESIASTFQEPLAQMTRAVERHTQGAAEGTGRVLENLISEFTAKIDDTFGQQMRGLNELMDSNSTALRNTSLAIEGLAGSLGDASRQAASTLSEQVNEAVSNLASTQSNFQSETQRTLAAIQDELRAMAESNTQVIDGVSASVSSMQSSTDKTATQLTESAASLSKSIADLERNASAMNTLTQSLNETLGLLQSTSSSLADSGRLASTASNQYLDASRNAAEVLRKTQEVLNAAKRDAQANEAIIQALESAADRIRSATRDLDSYLSSVDSALAQIHERFAEQLGTTLKAGNNTFQRELSDATSLLSGAIQELGEVVEGIPRPDARV